MRYTVHCQYLGYKHQSQTKVFLPKIILFSIFLVYHRGYQELVSLCVHMNFVILVSYAYNYPML